MSKIDERFNWGQTLATDNPDLYRQLNDAYTDVATSVNTKAQVYTTTATDPPGTLEQNAINKNFDIGDIWINQSTDTAWIMTSRTAADVATWTQIT